MSEPKFKRGDIVRIIKGFDGPAMMVEATDEALGVICFWYAIDGTLRERVFMADLLEPVSAELPDAPIVAIPAALQARADAVAKDTAQRLADEAAADRVRFAHTEGIEDA